MGRNIGENISKTLNCKYSQKLIDHAKQSASDALRTASKRLIQKTAEAKNNSPKNNSETNDKEILREQFIPPELRHEIFIDLRLKEESYWKLFVDLRLIY